MNTTWILLVAVLFSIVAVNGLPYEQANEEEYPASELENDHVPHHTSKKHEGKERSKRHKRQYLNQLGYSPYNSGNNVPGFGFAPVIGYCMPWPVAPPKPIEECPEKQILKELIKVLQNPPTIRVTCGDGKANNTTTPSIGNRINTGDDDKEDLSKLEFERNWGMVDPYPELSPEEQASYAERDIELNPYKATADAAQKSKTSRKIHQTRSIMNDARCEFVYTACCDDERTVRECYRRNGCETTFLQGNPCVEKSRDELHRYIRSTFKYTNSD